MILSADSGGIMRETRNIERKEIVDLLNNTLGTGEVGVPVWKKYRSEKRSR